jgi:hypothetical protein
MYNALLEGGQVNNPTFQPTQPTSITPAPIMQGAQLQGQANAANQSARAGIFGNALNALGTTAAGIWSDRRLKTQVERIGSRYGLPWYRFNIL